MKPLILLILAMIVLTGCSSYDRDCYEQTAKEYCNSINQSLGWVYAPSILSNTFNCNIERELGHTKFRFTQSEIESCTNKGG